LREFDSVRQEIVGQDKFDSAARSLEKQAGVRSKLRKHLCCRELVHSNGFNSPRSYRRKKAKGKRKKFARSDEIAGGTPAATGNA
jgi:hypothetical protein